MRLIVFLLLLSLSSIAQVELVNDTLNLPIRKISIGVIPKVILSDSTLEKEVNESLLRACINLGNEETFEQYVADYEADSLSPMLYQEFYGFKATLNQDSVLSVTEEVEGCGAYCEGYVNYANIDLTTGEKIMLKAIYTDLGISKIRTRVSMNKTKQIRDLIIDYKSTLDKIPADSIHEIQEFIQEFTDIIQLYKGCTNGILNWELEHFYMTSTHIVIHTGRCSNHAMRAIDELGDFYYKIPYNEFSADFTTFGKALIQRIKVKEKSPLQKANK